MKDDITANMTDGTMRAVGDALAKDAIARAVSDLERKLKLCVEALREIEFDTNHQNTLVCPYCGSTRQEGHSCDCPVGKALEEAGK